MVCQSLKIDISKKIAEELKYSIEANRRATFKSWVFNEKVKCSANKMAEAGFIFAGTKAEPDAVICFFCRKSLDYWKEDDDPWSEHQRHATDCDFAKTAKPEKCYTLREFLQMRHKLVENFLKKLHDDNLKFIDAAFEKLEQEASCSK